MPFLTKDDQLKIDGIVDNVSQKLGVSYPDNSLLDMANKAGIKVIETDLHKISPTLSGAIMYDDPSTKVGSTIFIEKTMPNNRKTFTLAHELGHHFMHEGTKLRLDDLDYSKDDIDTLEESQANYFAASLLVPKDILLKKRDDGLNISQLADFFQVSTSVIRNRLRWIGNN